MPMKITPKVVTSTPQTAASLEVAKPPAAKRPDSSFGPPAAGGAQPPELKSGPVGATSVDRAQTLLANLRASAAMLGGGPAVDRFKSDLQIAQRLISGSGASAYGKLSQVLDRLADALYRAGDGTLELPADLKADVQRGFMATYLDYLGELGGALEGWLAAAQATPNAQTFETLEERTRYAASAARGSGKAENEQFGRLADDLYAAVPGLAGPVKEARAKLQLHAEMVRQNRLDLIGVDNGGFPMVERAKLLSFDESQLDAAGLKQRLDAVEKAVKEGGGNFAGALLSEVNLKLFSLELLIPPFGKPLADDAELAKRRAAAKNPVAPLSLAEYQSAKARIEALKPAVWAAAFAAQISEAQLLFRQNLEGTRNLGDTAARLSLAPNATPEQRLAAQKLLVDVTRRDLDARQKAVDEISASVSAGAVLTEDQEELLRAFTQLPAQFAPRGELATVAAEVKGDLDQRIQTYDTARAALGGLVEGRFDATRKAIEAERSAVEALPLDQQDAQWQALSQKLAPLDVLSMWMPEALSRPADALSDVIWSRATGQTMD